MSNDDVNVSLVGAAARAATAIALVLGCGANSVSDHEIVTALGAAAGALYAVRRVSSHDARADVSLR
ncbi:MAG: hypothetical protein RIF41_06130 [Polyangiaceae bacterium]